MKENTLTHYFQNYYSKQIKHLLQIFPYGEKDVPLKETIREGWSPCKPKSLSFCWISLPPKNWVPLITDHTLEKKCLIAFRKVLPKLLPAACIFSCTINTCFRKLTVINPLTLFRMGLFGATHGWGGDGGWGKKTPLPKICHTYPTRIKLRTVI